MPRLPQYASGERPLTATGMDSAFPTIKRRSMTTRRNGRGPSDAKTTVGVRTPGPRLRCDAGLADRGAGVLGALAQRDLGNRAAAMAPLLASWTPMGVTSSPTDPERSRLWRGAQDFMLDTWLPDGATAIVTTRRMAICSSSPSMPWNSTRPVGFGEVALLVNHQYATGQDASNYASQICRRTTRPWRWPTGSKWSSGIGVPTTGKPQPLLLGPDWSGRPARRSLYVRNPEKHGGPACWSGCLDDLPERLR